MLHGILRQHVGSILDDLLHRDVDASADRASWHSDSCIDPTGVTPQLLTLPSRSNRHLAASFIGHSNSQPDIVSTSDTPATSSTSQAKKAYHNTSFFGLLDNPLAHSIPLLGNPKCKKGDFLSVGKCGECGDSKDKCDSNDCQMWDGKCRSTTVGKDVRGNDVKMGAWYYYFGATRPFKETGDWLKFGAYGQVVGPSGVKKPRTEMTEAEKKGDDKDTWNGKPFMTFALPGNKHWTQVKLLSETPPGPNDKEPESATAIGAMAEWRVQKKPRKNIIAGMGFQAPCDKQGRIHTATDGTFCEDDQACITSLPRDFHKHTGKFCWQWVVPECKPEPCPPPPYCPPKPPRPDGTVEPSLCPKPKPCPPPKPCEPPHWVNICSENQGQPWCAPADVIKKYRGPLEIQCSATGKKMTEDKDSPDGCHWLQKYTNRDLQRLPGKIKRHCGTETDLFTKDDDDALTDKQAVEWISKGKIPPPEPEDPSQPSKCCKTTAKENSCDSGDIKDVEVATVKPKEPDDTCDPNGDWLNCAGASFFRDSEINQA